MGTLCCTNLTGRINTSTSNNTKNLKKYVAEVPLQKGGGSIVQEVHRKNEPLATGCTGATVHTLVFSGGGYSWWWFL